jgi:PHD/YefM family antitoxin component YafN of YafNO toxin-antitoxin module
MTKSQCISVTQLRTETKKCLKGVEEEPKYIFVNNQPIAVIINIDDYENLCAKTELKELKQNEVSQKLKKEAQKAKKIKKSELINI